MYWTIVRTGSDSGELRPDWSSQVRYLAGRLNSSRNCLCCARLDGDAVNQTCAPCLRDRESHFRSPGARRLDLSRTLCFDCVRDAFPQYWPFPASSCRPAVNQKAREFEVEVICLRECGQVRGVSLESGQIVAD